MADDYAYSAARADGVRDATDRALALRHELTMAAAQLDAAAQLMSETWMKKSAALVRVAADRARAALAQDAEEHGT